MDEHLTETEVSAHVGTQGRSEVTPATPIRNPDHLSIAAPFRLGTGIPPAPYAPVPALTAEELEEWRWFQDPSAGTPEQQSRAQCDRQPTIASCLRDRAGRTRARPEPVSNPDRAPNDYDHLLDTRAYSPNNRIRGSWDFDREEIARENTFTPVDDEPEEGERPWIDIIPPRTPSPLPEANSLEALMSVSLAEIRPDSPRRPVFCTHGAPNNIGIRSHEVRDFARRFAALPPGLQGAVIAEQQSQDIFYMEALRRIETLVVEYELTPVQHRVYKKVQLLFNVARDDLRELNKESDDLVTVFRHLLFQHRIQTYPELDEYFEDLMLNGLESGPFPVPEFGYTLTLTYGKFWLNSVHLIDMEMLPWPLRRVAVLRFLNFKRVEEFSGMVVRLGEWLDHVGDRHREDGGVNVPGDFWTLADDWEAELEALEDQPKPDALETDDMSLKDLTLIVWGELEELSEGEGSEGEVSGQSEEDGGEDDRGTEE